MTDGSSALQGLGSSGDTRLPSASEQIFPSDLRAPFLPTQGPDLGQQTCLGQEFHLPLVMKSRTQLSAARPLASGCESPSVSCRGGLRLHTQPSCLLDFSCHFRSIKGTQYERSSPLTGSQRHTERNPRDDKAAMGVGHQGSPSSAGSTRSWKAGSRGLGGPPPGVSGDPQRLGLGHLLSRRVR